MNDYSHVTLADLNAAIRESDNSPSMLEARAAELQDKIYDERRQHGQLLVEAAAKVGVYMDDDERENFIASCQFDEGGLIRAELQQRIAEASRR